MFEINITDLFNAILPKENNSKTLVSCISLKILYMRNTSDDFNII
jgi:hypothetical protein